MPPPEMPEPAAPAPGSPSKGAFELLIGAFFSPGETFEHLAKAPVFVLPLVLVMILSMASSIIVANRIGIENIVRQQMMKNPRIAELPKDQLDQNIERGVKIGQVFVYIAWLRVPIVWLVISGVLLMMANFVFGGTSTFRQMFAATAHAASPPAVVLVILSLVIVMMKGDPSELDVENLVAANLGILIPAETSKFLHRMAVSIDFFSFWQIALFSFGIAAAARLSFSKALIAVAIPWAIWVLGVSGFAALFG